MLSSIEIYVRFLHLFKNKFILLNESILFDDTFSICKLLFSIISILLRVFILFRDISKNLMSLIDNNELRIKSLFESFKPAFLIVINLRFDNLGRCS